MKDRNDFSSTANREIKLRLLPIYSDFSMEYFVMDVIRIVVSIYVDENNFTLVDKKEEKKLVHEESGHTKHNNLNF